MIDKVAIFLDAESLGGRLTTIENETLVRAAQKWGRVVVRRAYGNFSQGSVSAHQQILNQQGFELLHTYHPVSGKNSADIQMVVDVMDYVMRFPELQHFVLATRDSDFLPLYRRLRELGKLVIGVGDRGTGTLEELLFQHYDHYIRLAPNPSAPPVSSPPSETPTPSITIAAVLANLQEILQTKPLGIHVTKLETQLKQRLCQFSPQALGFTDCLEFLRSQPKEIVIEGQKVFSQEHFVAQQATPKKTPATAQVTSTGVANQQQIIGHLKAILSQMPKGIRLKKLEEHLRNKNTSFQPQTLGYADFSTFLQNFPEIVTIVKGKAFSPEVGGHLALQHLQTLLQESPKGIRVNGLKTALRRVDPSFDEKALGHKRFLDFLKNQSEILTLEQRGTVWWVKGKAAK